MFKRNWIAIAKVPDYYMRLAVSLAKDPEILAGFVQGFPHLFMEGEDEGPLCVPLSVLKEAAYKHAQEEYPDPLPPNLWEQDSNFSLWVAAQAFGILAGPEWEDNSTGMKPSTIPPEVLQQFVGQKAQAGILIVYRGIRYIVLALVFNGNNYPVLGSVFEFPPELDYLLLANADFVALDK